MRDAAGDVVEGVPVDVEVQGPLNRLDPERADLRCVTDATGTCTVTYADGATSYDPFNYDEICGWIDADADHAFDETYWADPADGGYCDVEDRGESDDSPLEGVDSFGDDSTDRVLAEWRSPTLTITPVVDRAAVGTCNPLTITLLDWNGTGIPNVSLDVEQVHSLAANDTQGDEPKTSFCPPTSGPNPSAVDESRGDLIEAPDNLGTAGGETSNATDANGQLTIGLSIAAAGAAPPTGLVSLIAWRDEIDNEDRDAMEIASTASNTWATEPRTTQCESRTSRVEVAAEVTIDCIVRDNSGAPIAGEPVVVSSAGAGTLVPRPSGLGTTTVITDVAGVATFSAISFQLGTQTVTATVETDLMGQEPDEIDACDRASGDPPGAPAGSCTDVVAIDWMPPRGGSALPEICLTPGAIIGTDGDDVLGSGPANIICARDGDDQVFGRGAGERIFGGDGNDKLVGNSGRDLIRGGAGNDEIWGLAFSDVLWGNRGNDSLHGSHGDDTIYGGPGKDKVNGGIGQDKCLRVSRGEQVWNCP